MLTYKEVFQLAQDKGYKFYHWNLFELVDPLNIVQNDIKKERFTLIELTLIQKWLRDEHKIFLIPEMRNSISFCCNIYDSASIRLDTLMSFDTYEQALLEGINESLKLIP